MITGHYHLKTYATHCITAPYSHPSKWSQRPRTSWVRQRTPTAGIASRDRTNPSIDRYRLVLGRISAANHRSGSGKRSLSDDECRLGRVFRVRYAYLKSLGPVLSVRPSCRTARCREHPDYASSSSMQIKLELSDGEVREMKAAAKRAGCPSVSEYITGLHARAESDSRHTECNKDTLKDKYPLDGVQTYYKTSLGRILCGDALCYLFNGTAEQSVDLIMTSPPFGLVRKKSYGNKDAHHYCEWFRPFADGFRRVLKENGSLVIDIGGAWQPGAPTRSLYHFELLLMLCREYGFYLCQEHYWWNPSKLPTPAEWVNVRRVRVKDAVNCVWWLSPTPWPKANNRRVLAPYSDSMRSLMKNGYKAKLRPSGHDISDKFGKDNGGSVPPNLLAIANTESNGRYQDYCREHQLRIHPARFPESLPEYFIRMLTDSGDLVVDPFAGSCVTGAVAQHLGRRWVCCELDRSFLEGSVVRFSDPGPVQNRVKSATYSIAPPCSVSVNEDEVPLILDGGFRRSNASSDPKSINGQKAPLARTSAPREHLDSREPTA